MLWKTFCATACRPEQRMADTRVVQRDPGIAIPGLGEAGRFVPGRPHLVTPPRSDRLTNYARPRKSFVVPFPVNETVGQNDPPIGAY